MHPDAIRVLLIEDDPDDALVVKEAFAEVPSGRLELTHVQSFEEGIKRMHAERFEALLLDLGLPDSPGQKAVMEVNRRVPEIPLVVLTGRQDEDVALQAIREGAQDYLVKGQFDTWNLIRAIRYAISRKKTEMALRSSEEKYRSLVNNIPSVVWTSERGGEIIFMSPNVDRVLGYSAEEIQKQGHKFWTLNIHPEDFERAERAREEFFGGKGNFDVEFRVRRKDGQWVWVRDRSITTYERDGRKLADGMFTDVTERKLAELSLERSREQLRALAGRLHSLREEIGTNVAREIHDDMGQSLTALKIDLMSLSKQFSSVPQAMPAQDKIKVMTGLIDGTIQSIRRICTQLRPRVLDDLGLTAAIEWQANEFQSRTGIRCMLGLEKQLLTLDDAKATAIFRIFQEILTNVARHAQATQLDILLKQEEAWVLLRVADNGKGIRAEDKENPKSLGILGMRERALAVGGEVEIDPGPTGGTVVTVRVPNLKPKT